MIWSVDPENFGLLTFNQGLSDYFLQKRSMRIQKGMTPQDLFPTPDFVQVWCDFYRRALQEGPYSTEYQTYSVSITLQLTFNLLQRNGTVFGISVFGKDITGRKQMENALRESEARFRSFIEQAPVAILISRNRIGVYANPKFLELFGLQSSAEFIDQPVYKHFSPHYQEIWAERNHRRSQGLEVSNEAESYGLRSDGSQFPVHLATGTIHLPDGVADMGFVTDITERKHVEEALRESETRFRTLIEQSSEGVMLVDENMQVIEWNPAQEKITGISRADAIGVFHWDIQYRMMPPERQKLRTPEFFR
jgi:PAS domain S-box-containing protein